MGGDNIIDNSYVTFDESSKITLSGGSGTIVPVGGYVGVVVFGGVIFKNMDSRKTTLESTNLNVVYTGKKYNLADNSGQEAWAAIYVNPIVGRVINGYAVNETGGNALDANGNKVQQFSQSEDGTYHDEDGSTRENVTEHTLKNGKKHYSIADIDPKLEKLDVESVPSNALTDGVINISNSQAFFILSLITQSTSGTAQTATGGYVKSLSYGTNDSNVYGMSHTGSYADVGTSESTSADFTDCASGDTAANTAVPYIISRFTKRTDDIINSIIETTYSTYTGEVAGLDGKTFRISNRNGSKQYFGNGISSNKLTYTSKEADAALWTFEKYSDSTYYISIYVNESIKYMCMDGTNGNMSLADSKDTATAFTVISYKNKFVLNSGSYYVNRYGGNNLTGFAGWTAYINDTGSQHDLVQQIITEREEIIYGGYNARCVTSTLGYYDINLTGSEYVLPDSFRGLGSVGYYDDTSDKSNKFSIKLDVLSGNNCTIDKDIYLNKYHVDNYFNVLHKNNSAKQDISSNVISDIKETTVNDSKTFHGIGLFDSVIMKGQSSSISKITVSGSLNTEIYNNSYTSSKTEQEKKEYNVKESLFLACGGVIGWSTGTQWCNFNKVNLDSLSIRGSCFVAGLLGYSGNNSKDVYVTVQECNVNDLALCLTAASYTKTDDKDKRRFGMGAYVGKVFQGGVLVYGTDMKDRNNKLDNFSTVKLSKYEIPDNSFSICAGGLVGYAGHGLKAYDVKVEPQTDKTIINIGEIPDDQANATAIAGGIVGLMQPQSINDEDIKSCTATFINCEVKNINIAGEYAGGLYGGTWGKVGSQDSAWVPYMINLENCKITGLDSTNKNTIKATKLAGGAVAYAKVSKAGNPNFLISNTTISNYKIDAKIEDMSSYKVVGNGRIKDCWTIELKKFQNDNNKNFSSPTFNAMIAKDIDVTEKLGTGKYDKVERSDAYDVYVIKDGETSYYKYNTDNQGDYDLTVAENYTLCEDYYLSIYVPKPKNYGTEIYHYKAIAPNQLDANNIDYSGEDPKIHSAGVTQPFKCNLMVADLFKQTVDGLMTVTPNNEQITANNKKITVDISALIEPNSKSGVFYVNSDEFFHSFYLTLIRNSENGIESDIKGLKTSNITAKYSINSKVTGDSPVCANVDLNDYYLNIQTAPADKSSELVGHLQGENQKFTVYARIEMDFDEDQLSDEFPIRETGNEYGVNVRAASNLAYDSDTLPYTSMTKSYAQDIHYYYIEAIPSAILTYSMKKGDMDQYDEIGFNSKNQSTLGVNGRSAAQAERTNMPINTEAFYNVQSLSDAKNAKILRLTFALNKKVDSGDPITGVDYQSIDSMQNYLDGTITFTSGNAVATVEATGGSVTVDLDATKCNVSGGIYDIDITFNAKSGSEFTEYANYKVNLKAELFKEENGEGNVENSVAEDYLIYTNAKINPNILADLKSQNN